MLYIIHFQRMNTQYLVLGFWFVKYTSMLLMEYIVTHDTLLDYELITYNQNIPDVFIPQVFHQKKECYLLYLQNINKS